MHPITIYLDGKFTKSSSEQLFQLTPGCMIGKGVFETLYVQGGKAGFFDEHIRRMSRGLGLFNIKSPITKKQIRNIIGQLFKKNKLSSARVRVSVWRQEKKCRVAIICQNVQRPPNAKYDQGFRVVISETARNRSKYSHVKSIDYKIFQLAHLEAKHNKYDEAILLNDKKQIVEGSRTNVFFVKNKILYTPAVHCGCLNGVTRKKVLAAAHTIGFRFRCVEAALPKLIKADEAFLTNSFLGLMPLAQIKNKRVGLKFPGPVTSQLSEAYADLEKEFCTSCL